MCSAQDDENGKKEAAFVQAIQLLEKNRYFDDAYYLGQIQLERGTQHVNALPLFMRNAYESGHLDECAEFLVALANKYPYDAYLLNLTAGLLGEMGQKQQCRTFAKMAAARKPLFLSTKKDARLHVLALQCIATGDYRYSPLSGNFCFPGITDLYGLLDPGIAVHRILVDDLSAALDVVSGLPKCDLVFNTISDPDYVEPLQNAAILCDALKLPVFNHPCRVRELNRASLPAAVRGKSDNLTAAKAIYLPSDRAGNNNIALAMRNNHLHFPVIIRAPGFQGGQHMALVENNIEELGEELYRDNGLYIIEFIDVSFQDHRVAGCFFYPKYRAFFANGRLFPIHRFVSDQYEVHRNTSLAVHARHPWFLDTETEYIRHPEQHLPEGLWNELKSAMASFGLDYFGVDFAVSARPEDFGKLVLFECNAAMANRIGHLPDGDRVQRQWHDVTFAAHAALCTKSNVEAWPFVLRKGLPVPP